MTTYELELKTNQTGKQELQDCDFLPLYPEFHTAEINA